MAGCLDGDGQEPEILLVRSLLYRTSVEGVCFHARETKAVKPAFSFFLETQSSSYSRRLGFFLLHSHCFPIYWNGMVLNLFIYGDCYYRSYFFPICQTFFIILEVMRGTMELNED